MSLLRDIVHLYGCLTIDDHYRNLTLAPAKTRPQVGPDPFILRGTFIYPRLSDGITPVRATRATFLTLPFVCIGQERIWGPLNVSVSGRMVLDDDGEIIALIRRECYVLPKDFF